MWHLLATAVWRYAAAPAVLCSSPTTCLNLVLRAGWWGSVFPSGVYANAANLLWRQVPGLAAFRVVAAILM